MQQFYDDRDQLFLWYKLGLSAEEYDRQFKQLYKLLVEQQDKCNHQWVPSNVVGNRKHCAICGINKNDAFTRISIRT